MSFTEGFGFVSPAGETSIAGSAYPVTPHVKAHETSHTGGWNPDPDHNDPNDNPPDGYSDDDTNSDSDDYSDDDPNDDLNDGSSDGQDFSNDGSGDGQDNSDDGSGDGQDSSDGPGDGQDDGQDDSNDDSDGSYPDNSSYGEHSTPTKGQEIPTKTLATTVTFTITNGSDCDTPPYSSDAPAVTIYKGAPQGNKRDDSGEAGSYWKGTRYVRPSPLVFCYLTPHSTITKTVTKTETVDAVCPTDPAAVGCAEGLVYEKLGFDGIEGYDSSQSFVTETPILYKDFTFEDYSLAFCEVSTTISLKTLKPLTLVLQNIEGKEDRVCEPATYEGDHFVALYSQANGRQSSLFHRITYEIENSDSKFQLLNFKVHTLKLL